MRIALVPAVLTAALAGCTPPGFSRLGDFSIQLKGNGGAAFAELSYDPHETGGCQSLPSDFAATSNGSPAETFPGGKHEVLVFDIGCDFPNITFPVPGLLGETLTLQATTQGQTIEVEMEGVALNVSGTPILAPGQQIHVGDLVLIQLGAGFERVNWPIRGVATADNLAGEFMLAAPSPAGVLQVQLPSTLPAGPTRVRVQASTDPEITRCSGPTGCQWLFPFSMMPGLDVVLDVVP